MGEIVVKLADDELIKQISDLARIHNRTPEREAEEILRNAAFRLKLGTKKAQQARRIATMTPGDRKQDDSTILLHEDRER